MGELFTIKIVDELARPCSESDIQANRIATTPTFCGSGGHFLMAAPGDQFFVFHGNAVLS
jgi:hypothetical protein